MKKIFISALLFLATCSAFAQLYAPVKRVTVVVDGYPMLSPDGKTILFESDRTGTSEIYTMDTTGANLKQLTFNNVNDDTPVWSPDGKTIVFYSERDNDGGDIYIMDADGKNQKRLTFAPGNDSHPKFSPDGQRIIFNSARNTPDLSVDWGKQQIEIFTMNTDGTDIRQITNFQTICSYPSISPDGSKVLFRRVTNTAGFNWDLSVNSRNSEIYVMKIDGSEVINISMSAAYDGWPTWTPDGKVVFASNRAGIPSRSALYLVNADGTGMQMITDPKYSYNQQSVSSNGKQIYAQRNAESFAGIDVLEIIQ